MDSDLVRRLEGDCIRLSEELGEVRAANEELSKEARDNAHWESVADRMRDEIALLTELLRYEHNRANSAIDREETAEMAAEESREEAERLRAAWKSARLRAQFRTLGARSQRRAAQAWRELFRGEQAALREAVNAGAERAEERDRYRLAWLSARRRAADEHVFGREALELRDEEIVRLRAELEEVRKSTHGPASHPPAITT